MTAGWTALGCEEGSSRAGRGPRRHGHPREGSTVCLGARRHRRLRQAQHNCSATSAGPALVRRDASAPNMAPFVQAVPRGRSPRQPGGRRGHRTLAARRAVRRFQPGDRGPGLPGRLARHAAGVGGGAVGRERPRRGRHVGVVGLPADTATTGREALRLALGSPDYEVACWMRSLDNPPTAWTLQQLRRDYRTARLRVGILRVPGIPPWPSIWPRTTRSHGSSPGRITWKPSRGR